MLLSGKSIVSRGIIRGLLSPTRQIQPCGVDLSVRRFLRWSDAGTVDFDNQHRRAATTEEIPFRKQETIHLGMGAYLVEFNEKAVTPLDITGQIFVRSSLFRSGATVSAGVMDAGYEGVIGAMLQVFNPHGLVLHQNAKIAQVVFHEMREKVEGYSGMYQNCETM